MNTTPSGRKLELLDRLLEYALQQGLSDSSLRAAASSAGTNARMLIYHFVSREQLVVELLDHARREQENLLRSSVQELPANAVSEKLNRIWHLLSSKRFEGHARLFFEAFGLGIQGKTEYKVALKSSVTFLAELIEHVFVESGLPRAQARTQAAMTAATMRGLVLDLLATGDRTRVNAAAFAFLEKIVTRAA